MTEVVETATEEEGRVQVGDLKVEEVKTREDVLL